MTSNLTIEEGNHKQKGTGESIYNQIDRNECRSKEKCNQKTTPET